MPGLDYELDPITGDWIPDGQGGFKTTDTNAPAVMHALNDKRGWPGDPNKGGNLEVLTSMTATEAAAAAPNLIHVALQPMIDDGFLRDVEVAVEREIDKVFIKTEIIDSAGGRLDVTDLTPFGE
jgi:hypothetical protein